MAVSIKPLQGSHNLQRIKRIITVTAIAAAVTGALTPGIASADKNTGQGSAGTSPTPQQICDALPGIVNGLAGVGGAMDTGSAAQVVVQAVQQAIFDAGSKACP
jgi:hypothetical protein